MIRSPHIQKRLSEAHGAKLKAAVPSGVWFKTWMRLVDEGGGFTFVDVENDTFVTVEITIDTGTIDAEVTIDKLKAGDKFKALQQFTTGK